MFGWFKRKIHIEEAARELVAFALDQQDIRTCLKDLPHSMHENMSTAEFELLFLRVFAVDLAVYIALQGRKREQTAIADRFKDYVIEIGQSTKLTSAFADMLLSRMDVYTLAITREHIRTSAQADLVTLASAAGSIYSRLCNRPDDQNLTYFGSQAFIGMVGGVRQFFSETRVTF